MVSICARPTEGDYKLIGASVTDDTWLKDAPVDRSTFVIFEGLSMYPYQDDGENLLRRVSAHFPSGEIAFDAVRPIMITCHAIFRDVKWTGTTQHWTVYLSRACRRASFSRFWTTYLGTGSVGNWSKFIVRALMR